MRPRCTWLSLPLLLLPLSAHADEPWRRGVGDADPDTLLVADVRYPTPPDAFDERDALDASRAWRRLHLSKGAGLEYRQPLSLGERDMVLGLKGPVMKKKRLGLAVELRF